MTVSRVLRHHPNVSSTTRAKVEAVLKEQDYRPNPMVATLMAQVAQTNAKRRTSGSSIAWISPHPSAKVWSETQRRQNLGAQDAAHELGFHLEHFFLTGPGMSTARIQKIIGARGIHGVILGPTQFGGRHSALDFDRLAAVSIGYTIWRPRLHVVTAQMHHGMLTATHELKLLGYRRIGLYLSHALDRISHHTWSSAFMYYQSRLRENCVVPPLLERGLWQQSNFERWVREHRPDVILSAHLPAVEWLQEMGLSVPGAIGFAHLDVQPSMKGCAGLDQNHEKIGSAAANLLASLIYQNSYGIPATHLVIMIEGKWTSGETVKRQEEDSRQTVRRATVSKCI